MEVRVASADYFAAMGIPVRRGRGFGTGDRAGSAPVVVLSESAARRYFAGEEPLGQHITVHMGRQAGLPTPGGEIVGVVGDVKDQGLSQDAPPVVYLAQAQLGFSTLDVLVRTEVSPRSLVPALEAAVHGLDPELPLMRLRTLEELVGRSISQPRFYVVLLGAFAGAALLLAALGVFGVLSQAVAQRRREIGIRVALGAHPRDVLRAVLSHALVLVAAGLAIGLAGALALSRTMTSLLFDLSPRDPATLLGVAVLLAAVAFVASYLPARRAARVDPLIALRSE
jgi:predicted permease